MILKKFFSILLFAFLTNISFSQITLKGKIFDAETKEPLPFVNVVFNDKGNGFTSGLDGDFKITTNDPVLWLKVSYLGYSPQTITINADNYNKPFKIGLTKTSYQLKEVIVKPGVNPAHRIIIAAYNNRSKNNPEKLASYRYTSYNKLSYTFGKLIADSIKQSVDARKKIDSLATKLEKMKKKHGLMIIETVAHKEFLAPNNIFENIIATKVSGFKDPVMSFTATQVQSFSFYNEQIILLDKSYLNPISSGSTKKYLFILEDTLFTPENDTLFVISYRPHKNRNFEGLMGQLTINSRGYAVQSVIAEPSLSIGLFSIKIQQRYELFKDSTWFPVELNTDIIYTPPPLFDKKAGIAYSWQMLAVGKSYLKDIVINPSLRRNNFSHFDTRIDPRAGEHNNAYWNLFRKDSLTAQELRTYRIVDSIGQKLKSDRIVRFMESLISARVPIGLFNINLGQIFKYNQFEGTRLGIGLETNRKVSELITVGGYAAYGFKDKSYKYGGFSELTFSRKNELSLKYSYASDVQESGTYSFINDNSMFAGGDNGRQIGVKIMDRIDEHRVAFTSRFLRSFKINLSLANQRYDLLSGLYYKNPVNNDTIKNFNQALFTAALRFAPGEKFTETPRVIIPSNLDFPVLWVKYTKGLDIMNGGYAYDKVEVRLDKTYRWKILGKSTISIDAGREFGKVPISLMYFGRANYLGSLTPDAAHSFAAMRMNEFISDRFVNIFFKHDFGKLLWITGSKIFQPEFAIVNNISFGDISANSLHVVPASFKAKVPTKGYYETGVYANKLLSNGYFAIGFGAFYRYDSYRFKDFKDNLAYKFTVMVVL